jgi:RNA polymerase sigma-70 factor (ECF subfamily)
LFSCGYFPGEYWMMSDEQLVVKSKRGNKRAFGKLVKKYQNKILYLCFDLLGNYDDAKDAAQEVFMKAYNKIVLFKGNAKFSTWIYRIAVNQCMDLLRIKNRHPVYPLGIFDHEERGLSEDYHGSTPEFLVSYLETKELKYIIDQAICQLSNQQKTVLVLKYYQDMKTSEIAEILNCSEDTVRVHLHRAIERLRKLLKNKINKDENENL